MAYANKATINDSSVFAKRVLLKIRKIIARLYRPQINQQIRRKVGQVEFSIICSNCIGGFFYHDAGREFTSPTINLYFDGCSFVNLLKKPKYYFAKDICFVEDAAYDFPVGVIEDVKIYFVHYKTNEEARDAWIRRKKRIVWNNIFVVATDRDGLNTPEMLDKFDKLPYPNKVLFSAKPYPQYKWVVYVPQFAQQDYVGTMTVYANFRGQRYYETCFDIAEWIRQRSLGNDTLPEIQ